MILRVEQVSRRVQPNAPGGMTETVHLLTPEDQPVDPTCEVVLILSGGDLGKFRPGERYELNLSPIGDAGAEDERRTGRAGGGGGGGGGGGS